MLLNLFEDHFKLNSRIEKWHENLQIATLIANILSTTISMLSIKNPKVPHIINIE